jgi:hypothetical protein
MRSIKVVLSLSIAALVFLALSACVSMEADGFIASHLTPQEKAELIFQKGLALYNDKLMEQNDLKAIPEVRDYFANALRADPLHAKAQEYLNKTDSFKEQRFQTYLKTAKRLKDKKGRTPGEDYELLVATQRALDLNPMDAEIYKIRLDTADVRKQVIQKRVDQLAALEKKLKTEKSQTEIAKIVPQTAKIITEIQLIDPGNRDAAAIKNSVNNIIAANAKKDLDDARAKLTAKKYSDAEAAALRAEKSMSGLSSEAKTEVASLKYQIYYKWAVDLYAAKKYESANTRVSQAIAVNRSSEALDLKAKIAKIGNAAAKSSAATDAKRDYDAEIDDILQTIDSAIDKGDLANAIDMVNVNIDRMNVQGNKDKLSAKKAAISDKVKSIYADAVAAYNDEDYEGARDGFRVVIKVNANYEQAQAYLEKANNKIRALEGN